MTRRKTWLVIGGLAVAGFLWHRRAAAEVPQPPSGALSGMGAFSFGRPPSSSYERVGRAAADAWFKAQANPLNLPALIILFRQHAQVYWPWIYDQLKSVYGMPVLYLERAKRDASNAVRAPSFTRAAAAGRGAGPRRLPGGRPIQRW